MTSSDNRQHRILMCYGKTAITPGRYLEDGLRSVGAGVDVYDKSVDFSVVDLSAYDAVVFVETNALVDVRNIHLVNIPKLYWITHGERRFARNMSICGVYRPDLILLAQSMHRTREFPAPAHFFPFAVDRNMFHCAVPLHQRKYGVAFAGTRNGNYPSRNHALQAIQSRFRETHKLSLYSGASGWEIGRLYGTSQIVFNHSPERMRHFNMRLFEGMGCGALVMTNDNPGQADVFRDREHYVIYDDTADLLNKIDYYLEHLEEAQAIADRGREYVLAYHTYEHRARQLLDLVDNFVRTGGMNDGAP